MLLLAAWSLSHWRRPGWQCDYYRAEAGDQAEPGTTTVSHHLDTLDTTNTYQTNVQRSNAHNININIVFSN